MKFLRFLALGLAAMAAHNALAAQATVIDGIVAQVEEDVVLYSELDRRVNSIKQQIRGRGGNLPPEDLLRKQVLDRLISESIQLQMAKRGGIRISDEQLNATIAEVARNNRMTPEQFRQALASDNISYPIFRDDIRNEMMIGQVRQRAVARRVFISQQEITDLMAQQADTGTTASEFRLSHIMIGVPENASSAELQKAQAKADALAEKARGGADFAELAISNSAGQEALEGGDLGWRNLNQMPTLFADAVKRLKKGDVAPVLRSPSGFHILKVMDERGGDTLPDTKVNQTHARHILIKTSAVMDDEQARDKLIELRNQIVNGADFEVLAKANSEDTGSGSQGGDLGWTNPGQFVPEFEQEMNRMKLNEISMPFKSPFGWHIVQVVGRRTEDQTEEVKKMKATQTLQKRKYDEEQEVWLRQIRDEAYIKVLDPALAKTQS